MKNLFRFTQLMMPCFLLTACASSPAPQDQLWIDVRSADEYRQQHLSEAVNIEYTSILEGVDRAGIDKDASILLYCGSGRRAGIALDALEAAGFTNVTNRGGLSDLLDQGLN